MMKPIINILSLLLILRCSFSYGQIEKYNFKRELKGVSEQWHTIILPDEIFGKTSNDLSDIRIFGITADNDTIETPYFLRIATERVSNKDVSFKTLNASHSDKGYYFTFELPTIETINQIKLEFKQNNFDWQIKLEGSQNQSEWFTVIENYRILSIKNEITDFQFTKLSFPSSKYRFFRLCIDSKEKPELTSARISQYEIIDGTFKNYTIRKFNIKENKENKQTEIDIELQMPVNVSQLKIDVNGSFDYYRPVTIKCLTDSIKTEKGWKYNYSTLTSATLNSIEKNEFKFSSTTVQRFKILIHNQDNQPLSIDTIQIKGYVHELVARFTEGASYFLTYGNNKAQRPNYDIDRFADKVPMTLTALELGSELSIEKEKALMTAPLFKNMTWLWTIMGLIILVLGWFSIKMLRK
ncbi:MAG: DUF3999 family protein [Flavobacteriaceae bacterium]|nr:DUF3999 family protein [Flavobacteriaceae bacterium]